jgi:hypothetical protein
MHSEAGPEIDRKGAAIQDVSNVCRPQGQRVLESTCHPEIRRREQGFVVGCD